MKNTLREYRERAGKTQLDIAVAANLSVSTVGGAESGREVNNLTKNRLALALGVAVEKLFPAE